MYLMFWEIFLSLFPLSISISEIDPCDSYKELREAHRSQYQKIVGFNDAHCDKNLSFGWYRFKGKAGLKIPDSCVKSRSCGTHAPGWFNGSHPSTLGAVSSGRVCFNWIGSCCAWFVPVKVKRCNGFYIYQLSQTVACDLQYCGDGAPDPACATDNNDITINGSLPGSLSSPNFPGQYPNGLQCTWRITAPAGMKVRIVLKNATFGSNDFILLRDGLQDDSPQIAKYAECATGELRLYSTDRYILVKFVSDGSEAASGFRLEYESVESSKVNCSSYKEDICQQSNDVINLSGIIRSPGLPGSPSGNLSCRWNLDLPVGYKTLIEFTWFGLAEQGRHSACGEHYVKFREEDEEQWNLYCGCKLPPKLLYNTTKIYTIFNNSYAANQTGFLFKYRAVGANECTDGVDSCEMGMESVGMNKDGDLCYEKTTTTLPPPTIATTKQDDYVMDVTCDNDEINAVLHIRTTLSNDLENVHLTDPSCRPFFQNSTHIFVKSPLGGCGTTSNLSNDGKSIIYSNAIYADVRNEKQLGPFATRDHQAVFVMQCLYKRRMVLSTVSFDTSKIYIITDLVSFGNFTFEMNMFKSGQFREYYTEYPVGPIDVNTKIFLQVSVKSNDSGLVILVEECRATPTADYDDEVKYIFIENGCSKDNTVTYNYTLSSVQRFSLSSFNFRREKSDEVFLHCQAKVCRRLDLSSRCAQGCPFGKRRKRHSEYEFDQHLAIGPIIISNSQPIEKTARTPPDKATIATGVLAGVLGFIFVLLLAALGAIICKPHRAPKPSGATGTLLVRDTEPG